MACSPQYDAHGTTFIVPAAEIVKTPGSKTRSGYPEVQVWWSRSFAGKAEETLLLHQHYKDRPTADVIELTLGQTYDLIQALNQAVEST